MLSAVVADVANSRWLPPDFVLPPHLDRFAIYGDDQPQTSPADPRFSSPEGHQGEDFGARTRLAKPAMRYPEGAEEFVPRPKLTRVKGKL